METAHTCHALTCAAAALAFCSLCALLETGACTCPALDEWVDVDFFLDTLCGVEERDVGLYFDVVAHKDFLLEWVASAATAPSLAACEGSEEVFEVYVLKSALETTCTLCAAEPAKAAESSSCEWVPARSRSSTCSWVEAAI